jgi:ribosome-associated protein
MTYLGGAMMRISPSEHTKLPNEFQGARGFEFLPGRLIPASELEFRFSRSGGPGGQNVNKVASRVELLFSPSGSTAFTPEERERLVRALEGRLDRRGYIHVAAEESRSQWENRQKATAKLSDLLSRALRVRKARRATRATAGSRVRRKEGKVRHSRKKKLRSSRGREIE